MTMEQFLSGIELFRDLSAGELGQVAATCTARVVEAGQVLFEENTARTGLYLIRDGEVELFKRTPFGEEKRLAHFRAGDFLGEGVLMNEDPHSTSARALSRAEILVLDASRLGVLLTSQPAIGVKVLSRTARVIVRRMRSTTARVIDENAQYVSGRTRREHDLLGERDVPHEYYYGIQTLRALENFPISGVTLDLYPALIEALAWVKMASARANQDLGLIATPIADAIVRACEEIIDGKLHNQFVVDMIQGGAGTSTNMNANEVIANRALELLGHEKGDYDHCHPNNHVNCSQSTNDAYPTSLKLAIIGSNQKLVLVLQQLIGSFRAKAVEFGGVIKMGRTQLQDAVPMTLGQEFEAYATTLAEEVERLEQNARLFLEINLGGTAIGTGINAAPGYAEKAVGHLCDATGLPFVLAPNLVEATQDTGAFVIYSSAVKRLAVKLSKICNDLRLLSSGPRAGINEINLPKMQPGSSIMPGKVNPVIPEVVNQIAFKVIGNDLTVTMAAEAGQLELNVMEPVIAECIFESIEMLKNGMATLKYRCVDGITANVRRCRTMVERSIGLVTALNPVLGYETCTTLARIALEEDRSVYDLVLERGLLSREELDRLLDPETMLAPQRTKGN
jgi:aspartate ammonia-lyase